MFDSGKKRKWQCFVCGQQHGNYDDYKDHILENHDEGREFIKCPTCSAPVRDIPLHYQVKHPNRIPPGNVQNRVSVWYDYSKEGKMKARKPHFRQGFFESQKMGSSLQYRSGYECEVYELLEADREVAAYYAEPFKVPYCYEGKWYDYIPDLRVNYLDGRVQIMEIKPANQTQIEKNKAKWEAMQTYAEKMGWEFTVITEVGIGKMKVKVKQQSQE